MQACTFRLLTLVVSDGVKWITHAILNCDFKWTKLKSSSRKGNYEKPDNLFLFQVLFPQLKIKKQEAVIKRMVWVVVISVAAGLASSKL